MDVSLIIRLIDQFSGPAKNIKNTLDSIGHGMKEFSAGISGAFKDGFSVDNIDKATKNAEQKLNKARSRLMGAAAQALTLFGPVKIAADFETEMNRVQALTDATGEEFEKLKKQALDLGRTTQFTARQAADAQGFLAMAGFKTNAILEAMPGTLQLAASAQIDLAKAADIVTNVLTGYNKKGEELGHINDVLVKAFSSANTDLLQLAQALKYAGPVASAAGLKFEETTAAISLMGNAGIQASMAGTGLRGAITRMLNPTKQVREAMEEANLTFTDAKGRLLPLDQIIKQLEPHADDAGLMMKLFGQRAGPAMMALVSQGSDALDELIDQLENSGGTAERVSKVQMKGFNGMLKELQSAAEGTAIALGTMLFPPLIALGDHLTVLLNKLTDYTEAHPVITQYVVQFAAALLGLSMTGRVLSYLFAGLRMGIIPLIGLFLKFNAAGRNVALGWRLMRVAFLGLKGTFGLVAASARIVAVAFRGVTSGALSAGRSIIATQGKVRTAMTGVRRLMALNTMWTIGFQIIDDLGRTPEQRLKEMQENAQHWQKISDDMDQSTFGKLWQGTKDGANSLMGLDKGVVPSEALSAWGKAKGEQFYAIALGWVEQIKAGFTVAWSTVSAWFTEKINELKSLFSFEMKIKWPEPPAWLSYLMSMAGKGIDDAKNAIHSGSAGALLPGGLPSGSPPVSPLADRKVQSTVEVLNKNPPHTTVHMQNHIIVNEAKSGKDTAAQLGSLFGEKLHNAMSGSLHEGTE